MFRGVLVIMGIYKKHAKAKLPKQSVKMGYAVEGYMKSGLWHWGKSNPAYLRRNGL